MLPTDIQSQIDELYVFLDVAVPERPGAGIDGFIPLIEHIKDRGGVFLLKWDGERTSRHYTVFVSHPEIDVFRLDHQSLEVATAKAIIHFAESCLGFPASDG